MRSTKVIENKGFIRFFHSNQSENRILFETLSLIVVDSCITNTHQAMTQQLYTRSIPRPAPRRTRKRTTPFLKPLSQRVSPWWRNPYVLAAGWGIALFSLLFDASSHLHASTADTKETCQRMVQSSAVLSRAQLAQILTVPERSSQQSVRAIVADPYCQLPSLELRDGITAEREAYPLAFSPTTWLVMLYEGDEYAGFAFSFQ